MVKVRLFQFSFSTIKYSIKFSCFRHISNYGVSSFSIFRIKILPIIYNNNNNVKELWGKKQLTEVKSFHYDSTTFIQLISKVFRTKEVDYAGVSALTKRKLFFVNFVIKNMFMSASVYELCGRFVIVRSESLKVSSIAWISFIILEMCLFTQILP